MSFLLAPAAALYKIGSELRAAAYRRHWLTSRRLHRPVISIGNLTVGGTGKTPMVAYLARLLLRHGWKPDILTRGYARRSGTLQVIAPGDERAPDPDLTGDEPALLARWLPTVPIVIDTDRYRAGVVAERRFASDVHLLDDGFQHRALARDLDIAVLDSTDEFSDRRILPAGRQREACSGLRRAEVVVLTRTELADPTNLTRQISAINPRAQVFAACTSLRGLFDVGTRQEHPAEVCRQKDVHAFCGIGNPAAFFADLEAWGFRVTTKTAFRDHKRYTSAELGALRAALRQSDGGALLTTEKDAIKLSGLVDAGASPPVLACVTEMHVIAAEKFEAILLKKLQAMRAST